MLKKKTDNGAVLRVGLFLLVFGLWYEMGVQDVMDYLWITGAIFFVGAFALLSVGLYWKRAPMWCGRTWLAIRERRRSASPRSKMTLGTALQRTTLRQLPC